MIEFLTLNPKAFGLDISDLSLKFIDLEKKGNFLSLASWGEIAVRPGIIEEGEIKDEEALSEIIKDGLNKVKGKKLKTRDVIASLPEKNAFLQVIKMPKMKEEELEKAIIFEAENYIPLPIEEVYLDFQVVPPLRGGYSDHLDVLIAALPKKTTDPYLSSLKKAGLSPKVLEIESQSISRALVKNEMTPSPILLIDFGRSRTTLIIFSGHSLRFTSTIPISSQKLTEAISRTLKKDLGEAEKLKIKYGLTVPKRDLRAGQKRTSESKKTEKREIFEVIIPILTDLVEQSKKYLNYYQTHADHEHLPSNGKKVEKILLSGRGANLKGLTDFLSSEFKIPVELGNPWIDILPAPLKKVPELSFEESLGYTTVLGLALRGIRGE